MKVQKSPIFYTIKASEDEYYFIIKALAFMRDSEETEKLPETVNILNEMLNKMVVSK